MRLRCAVTAVMKKVPEVFVLCGRDMVKLYFVRVLCRGERRQFRRYGCASTHAFGRAVWGYARFFTDQLKLVPSAQPTFVGDGRGAGWVNDTARAFPYWVLWFSPASQPNALVLPLQ